MRLNFHYRQNSHFKNTLLRKRNTTIPYYYHTVTITVAISNEEFSSCLTHTHKPGIRVLGQELSSVSWERTHTELQTQR